MQEDSSSTHFEPNLEDTKLEVDEKAYNDLVFLDLDIPSQSIAILNENLHFAGKLDNEQGFFYTIPIEDVKGETLDRLTKIPLEFYCNRMRSYQDKIFLIGDHQLAKFQNNHITYAATRADFSFGLCVTEQGVAVGKQDGEMLFFDYDLNLVSSCKPHTSSIESIVHSEGAFYTSSSDHTIVVTKDGTCTPLYSQEVDINSIDFRNNTLVFGDDNGTVGFINGNKAYLIPGWHKSPIEMIRFTTFNNEMTLCACSQEQLSIWDLALENDLELNIDYTAELSQVRETMIIEKKEDFLLFVHQGQTFFKDIEFLENTVITTGSEGLSMFEPISFSTSME